MTLLAKQEVLSPGPLIMVLDVYPAKLAFTHPETSSGNDS